MIQDVNFTNMKLRGENITGYANPQVLEQIRQLKGTPNEILEECKNIFAKELGYNPNLLKLKFIDSPTPMAFHCAFGEIWVNPSMIQKCKTSKYLLATCIRHEMDHMDCFASLCKSIGIENFKKMLLKIEPEVKFNYEFWEEAIKNAKTISKKEAKLYSGALINYKLPEINVRKIYDTILYSANPIEGRAYDIEANLAKSLNNLSNHGESQMILVSKLSRKIVSMIETLKKKNNNIDERKLIQDIAEKEVLNNGDKFALDKLLNTILNKLENMY